MRTIRITIFELVNALILNGLVIKKLLNYMVRYS